MQLEEMTVVPEHERKPIPSDVQEILKEMEDLRAQFKEAKVQHEKKLEELAAERTAELAKINETHEVAMNELTRERDSGVVTFKALQESSALSDRERTEKIAELENQIEDLKKTHAELIEQHAIALEDLRKELESTWTARLETRISELEEVREEALAAAEAKLQKTGVSKEVEIKTLKDSFTEKMQALEHEQEDREVKLTSAHEQEIQDWKDQLTRATEDHRETMDQMQIQLKDVRTQLKKKDEALEETLQAKQEVESEFDQYRSEMKEQMDSFRTELEAIQKLLMDKEAEARELENKVQELTDDLENTSISSMLKNTKKYKVKEIHIYGSTVSGNLQIKRAQQSISDTLEQLEISYDFVDISSSEDSKRYMRRKNGGDTRLPQIFSGGEYRGTHEEFQYAVETHQILQFLGFDRVKPFVGPNAAPHSSTLAPNSTSSEFKGQQVRGAQHGEDAEQGAGQPNIVVNGVSSGPSGNAKDIATSMYLMSPGSTRFQSQRSLYAPGLNGTAGSTGSLASYASSTGSVRGRKSGFVQAASQVWNGALKEESGLGRHDLGFHTIQGGANNSVRGGVVGVLADDDELDELFEQGAVTEAELEAMLASGAL
ncbi:hypothetical protein BGW38_002176 [Lunasporangiospora selenospora]|uniref:Glutaredoxin domain-containing protein n=1 Tax=Lunasporangiospora selenospora TaxID=979761 RepID=A0A9P6G378_9FUNG|nr:hypothetical protein BGW38_002176 [Lunasporangiospora selenospora]